MSRKKNTAKDKVQSDKASKNKKDINTTDELVEKEAKVELSIEEQLAVEKDKNLYKWN